MACTGAPSGTAVGSRARPRRRDSATAEGSSTTWPSSMAEMLTTSWPANTQTGSNGSSKRRLKGLFFPQDDSKPQRGSAQRPQSKQVVCYFEPSGPSYGRFSVQKWPFQACFGAVFRTITCAMATFAQFTPIRFYPTPIWTPLHQNS